MPTIRDFGGVMVTDIFMSLVTMVVVGVIMFYTYEWFNGDDDDLI
jgi:hypothetical protein